ncbi:fasciclin-like arabinogalactan protein 14 [Ricinus communis]|uniref:Glycoprotein X, putative n=1 Tax=Ricinus communis TaxID=3988 RepID=B9RGR5_RICCO|nr:fasciclin-like arabinogalactan protein 14 [Ricinus communis]EEF49277.1 Glycoprotein X precursor, putative [Ricinus communis]|eukprot:XP_002512774.1 fasciclin-like arabinogalactan protein 14 [Ricinus communis]
MSLLTLSSNSVPALCFSFFILFSTVSAFNITKILSDHSDFSNFNDLLTKTQLAATINSRQTITILAVDNGNISPISGQSVDMQKKILSMHVILDYYDDAKLQKLPNKTELLTTLYQSSGQAKGQEGFLNATLVNNQVTLGSAVPGSGLNAKLVKAVVTQPYNVSILQVSSIIMPSSGGSSSSNSSSNSTSAPPSSSTSSSPASSPGNSPAAPKSSPSPAGSKAPAPTTGKAPAAAPKAPSDASSPSSEAETPAGSPQASSNAPSGSPQASTPADAAVPTADTPVSSPPAMGPTADAPTADGPAADTPAPSGATTIVGTGPRAAMVVMVLYPLLALAKMI